MQTLDDLLALCAETGAAGSETIQREAAYFHEHQDHIHYKELAWRNNDWDEIWELN